MHAAAVERQAGSEAVGVVSCLSERRAQAKSEFVLFFFFLSWASVKFQVAGDKAAVDGTRSRWNVEDVGGVR